LWLTELSKFFKIIHTAGLLHESDRNDVRSLCASETNLGQAGVEHPRARFCRELVASLQARTKVDMSDSIPQPNDLPAAGRRRPLCSLRC
jgi:hypothetical protein